MDNDFKKFLLFLFGQARKWIPVGFFLAAGALLAFRIFGRTYIKIINY